MPLVNQTEFLGLVKGSFESPSLSRNSSRLVLEVLLHYIARVRADKAFPTSWEQLRGHFDEQLATSWHQGQSAHVSRTQFLRANREDLQLFISMDCATDVERPLAAGEEPQVNLVEKFCNGIYAMLAFIPHVCGLGTRCMCRPNSFALRGAPFALWFCCRRHPTLHSQRNATDTRRAKDLSNNWLVCGARRHHV